MVQPISPRAAPFGIALVDFDVVRQNRRWFIGLGVAFVVLGVLAILMPFAASLVTTMFLGWLMLLGGVFQGIHAVQNRQWGHSTWFIVSAVIQVVTGLLVVSFPLAGTLSLTLIFAAYFLAEGIIKIVRAQQHRGMYAWGWLLFDGLLALALGAIILWSWPGTAVWVLGLLLGINLLFGGSSMLLLGLGAGRAPSNHG